VPESTITDRTKLLLDHAKELIAAGTLPAGVVEIREHRFKHICEGYFLLNWAYKDWRIEDGHFTELPKVAALQCLTISRYQPFFPLKTPVDEANIVELKPNEIFAFSYALGILGVEFEADTPEKIDFWLRVLDVISTARIQTLETYSVDKSAKISQPLSYYRDQITSIHPDDKGTISALICIFELMSKKRTDLGITH